MSNLIDVAELKSLLVDAAAKSFGDLIDRYSGDRFYGFALYTVDDLAGINPSASTERGFEHRKERLLSDERHLRRFKEYNIEIEAVLFGDYRWSVYEWEHECHLVDAFHSASELIRNAASRARDAEDPSVFGLLSGTILATMVLALHQLDLNGFFMNAQSREAITLLCSKPSSFDTIWLERESVRRLNPPAVFETFRRQRIEYISDELHDADDDREALIQFNTVIEKSRLFGA